jgi:hypothetical protein
MLTNRLSLPMSSKSLPESRLAQEKFMRHFVCRRKPVHIGFQVISRSLQPPPAFLHGHVIMKMQYSNAEKRGDKSERTSLKCAAIHCSVRRWSCRVIFPLLRSMKKKKRIKLQLAQKFRHFGNYRQNTHSWREKNRRPNYPTINIQNFRDFCELMKCL